MSPLWLILGTAMILMGIFDTRLKQWLGLKPASALLVTPNLKQASQKMEKISRWCTGTIGASFFTLGIGDLLPQGIAYKISFGLFGISILLLLTIAGMTIASRKAK